MTNMRIENRILRRMLTVGCASACFLSATQIAKAKKKPPKTNGKPSGIYAQSDKDWMAEVPFPNPVPQKDEIVEIILSDKVVLHTEGWKRRDPSDIIRVGDIYYVWYAKIHKDTPGFPGGWCATTYYATSKNGIDWEEQGQAIDVGEPGAWDDTGVYTPNILAYKGKYYLTYTGLKGPFIKKYCQAAIGMAVADSPDGPWKKLDTNPIVAPTDSLDAPDGFLCDDSVFVVKDNKIWLYYKGYAKGTDPKNGKAMRLRGTYLLVATADQPAGPYTKYGKILHRGHEAVVWKNPDGSVGSFCTGSGPEMYYESKDGFNFVPMNKIIRQKALGLYRADLGEGNPGTKPTWGISAINNRQGLGLIPITIEWPTADSPASKKPETTADSKSKKRKRKK